MSREKTFIRRRQLAETRTRIAVAEDAIEIAMISGWEYIPQDMGEELHRIAEDLTRIRRKLRNEIW